MTGTPIRLSRTTAALLTTLLAVSGLPSLSASGSSNPEILDPSGDVNPAAFFVNTPENEGAFENLTAYDLEKVYVLLESANDLLLQFKVRDLPDRWGLPAELPPDEGAAGPNASQPSVVLSANFTVRGVSYEAKANLSQPTGQGLRDSYSISRQGSGAVSVPGSYDVAANTVTISIRKDLLGSPRNADVLSQFRAEGRFGDAKLDFAPNAVNAEPDAGTDIVSIILQTLTGQQVVQPRYGANYTFRYYEGSGDIEVNAPVLAKTVGAGGAVFYTIQVTNRGSAADTVVFTLSPADTGFQHSVSKTEVYLGVGGTETVQLSVGTAPAARGLALSIVEVRSRLGDSSVVIFETTIVENGPTESPGQSFPVESPEGPDQDPSSKAPFSPTRQRTKGVPGFAAVAVFVAAAAFVAFVASRRT